MRTYYSDMRNWLYVVERKPDCRACWVTYGQHMAANQCEWMVPGTFIDG